MFVFRYQQKCLCDQNKCYEKQIEHMQNNSYDFLLFLKIKLNTPPNQKKKNNRENAAHLRVMQRIRAAEKSHKFSFFQLSDAFN